MNTEAKSLNLSLHLNYSVATERLCGMIIPQISILWKAVRSAVPSAIRGGGGQKKIKDKKPLRLCCRRMKPFKSICSQCSFTVDTICLRSFYPPWTSRRLELIIWSLGGSPFRLPSAINFHLSSLTTVRRSILLNVLWFRRTLLLLTSFKWL